MLPVEPAGPGPPVRETPSLQLPLSGPARICQRPRTGTVETMYFIQLVKIKRMVSRDLIAENLKQIEAEEKAGVRTLSVYWTLGPYDAIVTIEAPDEKAAMKTALVRGDWAETATLVAIPATEARKLVER